MTWTILQLDRRGSLNLPANLKHRYNLTPAGTPLAMLEANGVMIVVPLVGDAHQVYAAHGEAGLTQWVTQQVNLPINTTAPPYSPTVPRKTVAEAKLEAQERRMRLSHDLKMQQIAAQAQIIQLRRVTIKERVEAQLAAKDERNAARHAPPVVPPATPEQVEKFQQEQAAMLSASTAAPDPDLEAEQRIVPDSRRDVLVELGLPQAEV